MSLPSLFQAAFRTLFSAASRHRGLVVLSAAVLVLASGAWSAASRRPPLLAPAVHAVSGTLLSALARPLRVARCFDLTRGTSARIMDLELRVAALEEANRENLRLRAMLGYTTPPGFHARPAHIVGLDLDPLRGVGWIDAGRGDGLKGNEAVVTVDGLVGVVGDAHAGGALLRLLRNTDVAVGIRDTRSREVGILIWEPSGRRFRVENVPRSADMAVGDTLLTSGLGGVFPGRLAVGRVTEVRESSERLLKEIWVEPFAAFSRLEEVFVLVPWGLPPPPAFLDTTGTHAP